MYEVKVKSGQAREVQMVGRGHQGNSLSIKSGHVITDGRLELCTVFI